MKTIQIVVDPAGKTSITSTGFRGPACQEASRFLEEALGVGRKASVATGASKQVSAE